LATALAAGCHHAHKKTLVMRWAQAEGFAGDPHAVAGAKVFATSGCLACHGYLGRGSHSGDLTSIGRGRQGFRFFEAYVADPRKFGNRVMPRYGDLGSPERLHDLAVFLAASRGRR
jgi:mono/diheme cytochrome c family protein